MQDRALDVLARHLSGNRAALDAHLRLILQASQQQAVSVRKRAVDILWTCYINGDVYQGCDAAGRDVVALLLVQALRLFNGAPAA